MYQTITYHTNQEGIATIMLNRPEVFNAIIPQMLVELREALNIASSDKLVKVIILRAAGKAFCAGQDLSYFNKQEQAIPSVVVKKYYNPLIMDMRNCAKVIIAELNGVAVGAGCSLILACDMVLASENAVLSEAFVNIGLVPDSGSSYFLPRLLGRLKSFELLVTGRKIVASEAKELGLVNHVFKAEELEQSVLDYANQIAHGPAKAISLMKNMINMSYDYNLHEVLEMEAEMQDIAAATDDFKEGIKAFFEKRKPNFS
jgi:2-(1,2-epoxy-1,2-dihydrophenyl)acetyl-CoA isomerase